MHASPARLARLPQRLTLPGALLRLEGLALLSGAAIAYHWLGYHWGLFALLLLSPDLGALGYLHSRRAGSLTYNLMHTSSLPLVLGLSSLALGAPLGVQLALIWLAHIGMDRAVGYGLKYADSFKHTHLSEA